MQEIAYPYIETRVNSTIPISLSDIKSYLKLNANNNFVDAELTYLCETALSYAVKYSRQMFVRYDVVTNRCFWGEFRNGNLEEKFTLRRSPLVSVTTVKANNTTVSSDNYKVFINNGQYGQIFLTGDFPEVEEDLFPIEITFVAGYENLPNDIKVAMLQHIASMWMNRGDCDNDNYMKCPKSAKDIYKIYKIIEVGA